MNAMLRKRLRIAVLSSVASAPLFLFGQGIALATQGDDPIGIVTDVVDDTSDPITDTVDGTSDSITDTVDGASGTITDVVDDTTDPITDAVGEAGGTITDAVDGARGTITDTADLVIGPVVGGVEDVSGHGLGLAEGTAGGADDTVDGSDPASASGASTASRGYEGSRGMRASATGSSDLDELAQGGDDIVEGSGGTVCVGTARVLCLDLVGGLGPLGLLFRVAEEAGKVVSAFADSLARTGIDLLGAVVIFVMLAGTGTVLTARRRRPTAPPARGSRSLVRM